MKGIMEAIVDSTKKPGSKKKPAQPSPSAPKPVHAPAKKKKFMMM